MVQENIEIKNYSMDEPIITFGSESLILETHPELRETPERTPELEPIPECTHEPLPVPIPEPLPVPIPEPVPEPIPKQNRWCILS